ncbi:MAG: A24 family peptidase [Bacillota bacterium]|nr:A24 family peptidase [Bacillota bacterium]
MPVWTPLLLPWPWAAGQQAVLVGVLLGASIVDVKQRRIPNLLNLAGALLAFTFSLLGGKSFFWSSLKGSLTVFFLLLLLHLISRGRLGLGDVKLGFVLGAFLGPEAGLLAVTWAFLIGGGVALVLLLMKKISREDSLPLAPFFALGTLILYLDPHLWVP